MTLPFRMATLFRDSPVAAPVAPTRLLPGERELVRLRPTPGAWLGRYALALAWAAWGLYLWRGPLPAGAADLWRAGLAFAGPGLVATLVFLPGRRYARLALALLAAASCALVIVSGRPGAVSGALALSGFMALLLVEADRRLRTYRLTNLRILHNGGLWRRAPWTLHYDNVLDVDARQGPLGRALGYGSLVPVLAGPARPAPAKAAGGKRKPSRRAEVSVVDATAPTPALRGVGPFARVQALVRAFVQDATATTYLRAEQDTAGNVARAIADVGRANLRRKA